MSLDICLLCYYSIAYTSYAQIEVIEPIGAGEGVVLLEKQRIPPEACKCFLNFDGFEYQFHYIATGF